MVMHRMYIYSQFPWVSASLAIAFLGQKATAKYFAHVSAKYFAVDGANSTRFLGLTRATPSKINISTPRVQNILHHLCHLLTQTCKVRGHIPKILIMPNNTSFYFLPLRAQMLQRDND